MGIERHVKATLPLPTTAQALGETLNELGLSVEDADKPLGIKATRNELTLIYPAPVVKPRQPRKAKTDKKEESKTAAA